MAAGPANDTGAASRAELVSAVNDCKVEDLKKMGQNLAQRHTDLEELLVEMEAEKKTLEEDNEQVKNTIELMMKELGKLNIGASNTVNPSLEEGALDVGRRLWERVRPRDSAVVVSEHVGELKKPGAAAPDGSPTGPGRLGSQAQQLIRQGSQVGQQVGQQAQQVTQQVGQQAQQVTQQVGQQAQQVRQQVGQHAGQLIEKVGPQAQQAKQQAVEVGQKAQEAGKQAIGKIGAALGPWWQKAEGFLNAGDKPTKPKREKKIKPETNSGYPAADPTSVADAATPTSAASDDGPSKAQAQEAPAAQAPAVASAAASKVSPPASDVGGEQLSSTILIEARLTFPDGTVQTLHVRAADRCKEVAQRFVKDHELKAWYQEPLTAWLKKVEADAVKFPVTLEGDLQEIRKQHGKS